MKTFFSNARGFSLVEVLVVVAIMVVLMAVGVPALSDWLAGQRLRTASYALVGSAMQARSEAIKRGTDIAILAPASDDLSLGWCVQVGTAAACSVTAPGVAVMHVQQPISGVAFTFSSTAGPIVFNRSGRLSGGAVLVEIADNTRTDMKRCVTIDAGGNARVNGGGC